MREREREIAREREQWTKGGREGERDRAGKEREKGRGRGMERAGKGER